MVGISVVLKCCVFFGFVDIDATNFCVVDGSSSGISARSWFKALFSSIVAFVIVAVVTADVGLALLVMLFWLEMVLVN